MAFRIIEKLGAGKFGEVFKVKDDQGKIFAFKSIPSSKLKYIELDILMRLRSPYIIRSLKPFIVNMNGQFGFLQTLKDNNLESIDLESINYQQLKRIMLSCLYGIRCMHNKNYLHLDIGRKNILYDIDKTGNYTAYLSDFGWSIRTNNPYEGVQSSKFIKYKNTPIEILKSKKNKETKYMYSDKSDIWSLGIVFLELIGTKLVYENDNQFLEKLQSFDNSFIEERVRFYNKNKMSKEEEIALKDLLVHMLKIEESERISSKDLNKLRFMQTNILEDECVINKPEERVFLLYSSPSAREGLLKIKKFYYKNCQNTDIKLEEYFLTIQNFLYLMSKSSPYLDNDQLNEIIEESFNVSLNFYDRRNRNGNYSYADDLNEHIGYNFFYCADYIDDLQILHSHIMEGNQDILGYYNILDINAVFRDFRDKYEYKKEKRHNSLQKFFDEAVPKKKDKEEVDFIKAIDYHDIKQASIKKSKINDYKETEREFRSDIINHYQEAIIKIFLEDDTDLINILEKVIENKKYIDQLDNLKNRFLNRDISKHLKNINDNFNYAIIDMDYYGNVSTEDDIDSVDYAIIRREKRFSLCHISHRDKKVTHYYSDTKDELNQFFNEKGYEFSSNFSYGINDCCRIMEICMIFIIYYNKKQNKEDFHMKCLDYKTIKSVLITMMI